MVYPYQFTDFVWDLYELSYFEKYVDVCVLDLSAIINPRHSPSNKKESLKHDNVRRLTSLYQFYKYIETLPMNNKVCILDNIKYSSFKEVVCGLIMYVQLKKYKNIKIFDLYNGGVPIYRDDVNSLNAIWKFLLFSKNLANIQDMWKGFKRFFFKSLSVNISKMHTHYLAAGTEWLNLSQAYNLNHKTLVFGHSYDYSKFLQSRKNVRPSLVAGKKYAVFLADAGPFSGDDAYLGFRSCDVWFPSLVQFFDTLERETGVVVKIAGHYKSNYLPTEPLFGNRNVYYNQTLDLVKNCEYSITIQSTAISMSVAFEKPVICIFSNELKNEKITMRNINGLTSRLGISPINIDENFISDNFSDFLHVDLDQYSKYKSGVLTSSSSNEPNYKIILRDIMGVNTDQNKNKLNIL